MKKTPSPRRIRDYKWKEKKCIKIKERARLPKYVIVNNDNK